MFIHTCLCACMCARIRVCIFVCACVCMYARAYVCVCVCVCVRVGMCFCMSACLFVHYRNPAIWSFEVEVDSDSCSEHHRRTPRSALLDNSLLFLIVVKILRTTCLSQFAI